MSATINATNAIEASKSLELSTVHAETAFPQHMSRFSWQTWRKPLPLHKVLTQSPWSVSSNLSALFGLPPEIMAMVVSHIWKKALKRFALVNSDCYRLAQAGRFAKLSFHTTKHTIQEWDGLFSQLRPTRLASLASLQICIRYLDLVDDVGEDHLRTQELFQLIPSILPKLVNLEAFSCSHTVPITSKTLSAMFSSKIKHLGLYHVTLKLDRGWSFAEETGNKPWELESVELFKVKVNHSILTEMLRSCSGTLRRLRLEGVSWDGSPAFIPYPMLQTLLFVENDATVGAVDALTLQVPALTEFGMWDQCDVGRMEARNYLLRSDQSANLRAISIKAELALCVGLQPLLEHCPQLERLELLQNDDGGRIAWALIEAWSAGVVVPNKLSTLSLQLAEDARDVMDRAAMLAIFRHFPTLRNLRIQGISAPENAGLPEALQSLVRLECIVFGYIEFPALHSVDEDYAQRVLRFTSDCMQVLPKLKWMFVADYAVEIKSRVLSLREVHGQMGYTNRTFNILDPVAIGESTFRF